MLKKYVTLTLMAFFTVVGLLGNISAEAATKTKKKSRTSYSYTKKSKTNKKSRLANSKKSSKRYRRSGNGPDLRVLTTEKPNNEFTEAPDNGVNSVETKTGL